MLVRLLIVKSTAIIYAEVAVMNFNSANLANSTFSLFLKKSEKRPAIDRVTDEIIVTEIALDTCWLELSYIFSYDCGVLQQIDIEHWTD
jgi:hypothetical protein